MPLPDSSDVDAALIAALQADAQLRALLPDGVYFGLPEPGKKAVVLVWVVLHQDVATFGKPAGRRAIERITYGVKGVTPGKGADSKAAAARIDAVIEDVPLTIAGYTWLSSVRTERIRSVEPDPIDQSIRWQHRGGRYRIEVAPNPPA